MIAMSLALLVGCGGSSGGDEIKDIEQVSEDASNDWLLKSVENCTKAQRVVIDDTLYIACVEIDGTPRVFEEEVCYVTSTESCEDVR